MIFAALMLATLSPAAALAVPVASTPPSLTAPLTAAAWKQAAKASLDWSLTGHVRAKDATTVYVLSDTTYLYVGFDARQNGAVVATQHTNDVGLGTDDDVSVYLWPGGSTGFSYQFTSNPIGTHYQFSSENSAYQPVWTSVGSIEAGGYQVVMRIPLSAMRGARSGQPWLVEFTRNVESTGDVMVWPYDANETQPGSVAYAGEMSGIAAARVRPQPRAGVYGLGSIAGASAGGSTSRAGVDLSIPYTQTSSFYATLHPDYSNVELDQQTIAPTAFRRYYQEARPFFTQGQQAYDNFGCDECSFLAMLYTPAIPTPRDGYAVEGTQGPLSYGSFDALGDARNDSAQAVSYSNPAKTLTVAAQRDTVNMPGFFDDAAGGGFQWSDNKHLFAEAEYANDEGTNVLDGSRAQMYDTAAGWYTPTTNFGLAYRKIGQYYNPVDGFVWHPDIAGYQASFAHAWLEPKGSPIRSLILNSVVNAYHDHTGALDQTDQGLDLDVLTRGLIDVSLSGIGSSFVKNDFGEFVPATQNQYSVTFGSGAQNTNVNNGPDHGESATPTTFSLTNGRFGYGELNYWSVTTTQHLLGLGLLSFELDESDQHMDKGSILRQWLERIAYTYQSGPNTSFALGVRRIIGTEPTLDQIQLGSTPCGDCIVPQFQSGWNLSAAYHRVFSGANELYAVYGDASAFSTAPQFIVKWIHYFGATKGT